MNMVARPNYLFNTLSAQPAVQSMVTAFGPCWDMHTIAVVNIGKVPDFMTDYAAFQETNYFKQGGGISSGGSTLELRLRLRVGSSVKERILGQDYFGPRPSPWKEVEVFGGEKLDASGSFLIQRAMHECHHRHYDTLLLPPFGVKPFQNINKGYPLSHTAQMVIGAVYAYWTQNTSMSPSSVVIGTRDSDTYNTYADALEAFAGGTMKADPKAEIEEFQSHFAGFLLSPKYVRTGNPVTSRPSIHWMPDSHPARAVADSAYRTPYFFTVGEISLLSGLAVEDAKSSPYQLSPAYEILKILAVSPYSTVKMIAKYQKENLPNFEY